MTTEKLTNTVNRSGFPLQIGIEHQIDSTRKQHGWNVIYSEHSWKNPRDGSSGFIDLIVENQHQTSVLVVESKRVLESSWVFLVTDSRQLRRRHVKSWLSYEENDNYKYFGFKDITLEPTTPQSQYCVVDGQDPKSKPMLERIAAEVASSTEGFAFEEKKLHQKSKLGTLRMYFSVIVTTAKLKVCLFDPSKISISDGHIKDPKYTDVPYVRFRKQLSSSFEVPQHHSARDIKGISLAKENTVFVVNAESLTNFLCEFEVDDNSLTGIS